MDMKKRIGNLKNEDCESFERVTLLLLETFFEKKRNLWMNHKILLLHSVGKIFRLPPY